jgi:L-asparaginase
LKKAVDSGIILLNITQCNGGSVDQGRYQTSSAFNKLGLVSGYDMTTEAAITKLMFLLGQELTQSEIIKKLSVSLAGELTVS